MSSSWNTKSGFQKVLTVLSIVAVAAAIAAMIAQSYGWILPFDATALAFGVVTLCEAGIYWNTKRNLAYVFLIASLLLLSGFVLDFFD